VSRAGGDASLCRVLSRALLLLLVTLLVCVPVWALPDLDGTEGRRVQIALEMLRNGDWLVPSLGAEPTWAKPPLHYWLLALCIHCFGDGVWSVRLPSVLGAWLAALLAGELLRARFGTSAGWIGALGIAGSPLVAFVWPTAEIDPLFACFTGASLWCLAAGAASRRLGLVVASGALAGLALLQKGPPFFLFAAGAYWVWWRERRLWGVVAHVVPMVVVALVYYLPLWTLRVAPGEMLAVVNEESVGRVAYFEWRHVTDIPGYWLRALTLALPFGLWWRSRTALDGEQPQDAMALRMCRWAAGIAIVALTFFPGRPTRYLLPNVLLVVFAFAPVLARFAAAAAPLPRLARGVIVALGVAGGLALVALPFVPRAGVGALGLAAAFGAGAVLVRSRRHAVVLCLAMPMITAWTVGLDRSLAWPFAPRSRAHAGEVLRRELDRLGVDVAELRTMGHFDSPLLLAAGLLPAGDEFARGEWRGRWVLHEAGGHPPIVPPANYTPVLRLHLPLSNPAKSVKHFVLCERRGDAR
jgi:hypothetical protein